MRHSLPRSWSWSGVSGRDEGRSALGKIDLVPIRCSACGRFLGLAAVVDGVILLLCKNCKGWSVVAEGPTGNTLTTQELYDMLPNRGQKV